MMDFLKWQQPVGLVVAVLTVGLLIVGIVVVCNRFVRPPERSVLGALRGLLVAWLLYTGTVDVPGWEGLFSMGDFTFYSFWTMHGVATGMTVHRRRSHPGCQIGTDCGACAQQARPQGEVMRVTGSDRYEAAIQ